MPLITVIVPVYKVLPYLRRCVDSILHQTFTDFELILVDDGSPDGCGAVCDEYAAQDPRVRVIHKENGGLSSARNAGLAVARGELIWFIDSDDHIDPGLLEQAAEGIRGYDMVSFDFCSVDEDGSVLQRFRYRYGPASWENEQELFDYYLDVYFRRAIWSVWSRLFRKSIIDEHGLFFEDNNKIYAEDLYFTFLYLLHCRSINCLDAAGYHYTLRKGSIMDVQAGRHNLDRMIELIKAVEKHLDAQPGFSYMKKEFPVLFEAFFSVALYQTKEIVGRDNIPAVREIICSDVQDLAYFREQAAALLKHGDTLRARSGFIRSGEIRAEYRYYLDGRRSNYRIRWFAYRLLRKITGIIHHS